MKPFNLEEYCKNSSSKLVTRDGKKVTRLSYTDIENIFPITAIIEDNNNRKFMRTYTKEGTYYKIWNKWFYGKNRRGFYKRKYSENRPSTIYID